MYSFEQLIAYGFLSSVLVTLVIGMIERSKEAIQKVKDIKEQHRFKKSRNKPLVTVVVPTHNSQSYIATCLDLLAKTNYKKFEVIIVDNLSTDDTRKIVKRYTRRRNWKLFARRKHTSRRSAVAAAIARYARGEVIVILEPTAQISADFIERLARHFAYNKRLQTLAPVKRTLASTTISGVLQEFEDVSAERFRAYLNLSQKEPIAGAFAVRRSVVSGRSQSAIESKLKTLTHGPIPKARDTAVHIKPKTLRQLLFNEEGAPLAYREYIRPKKISQRLVSGWNLLIRWLEPLLTVYFVFIAIAYRQPLLLIISALLLYITLLYAVWTDDHTGSGKRLRLTAFIPMMFVVYVLVGLLQLLIISVRFMRRVIKRSKRSFAAFSDSAKLHRSASS